MILTIEVVIIIWWNVKESSQEAVSMIDVSSATAKSLKNTEPSAEY